MQAESAVNAVATPIEAPTCPPCVASSAGLAQVSGAQEPGVLGSQPESPVPHASTVPPPVTRQPSAFTHCMCVWSHTPCPLQPAVVQASLSVSGHGVLFEANMCDCTHTPSSGFVPLISHPAVVHPLPSVSVHGVLACCGVHVPAVWSQPRLHWSSVQHGQIGRSAVCPAPDCRVGLQVASPAPLV